MGSIHLSVLDGSSQACLRRGLSAIDVILRTEDGDQLVDRPGARDGYTLREDHLLAEGRIEGTMLRAGTLVVGNTGQVKTIDRSTDVKDESVDGNVRRRGEAIGDNAKPARSSVTDTLVAGAYGLGVRGVELKLFRVDRHVLSHNELRKVSQVHRTFSLVTGAASGRTVRCIPPGTTPATWDNVIDC